MVERGLSLKKTGLWDARIAHGNMQNDIADSDPQTFFNYATSQLAKRGLAYLHVVEGDTSGNPVPPSEVGFRSYFSPYAIRLLRLRRSACQLLGREPPCRGLVSPGTSRPGLDLERARFLSALLQTLGSGASALWNGLGKRTIEHWAGLHRPVTHASEAITYRIGAPLIAPSCSRGLLDQPNSSPISFAIAAESMPPSARSRVTTSVPAAPPPSSLGRMLFALPGLVGPEQC